jgi:hypothetical protein
MTRLIAAAGMAVGLLAFACGSAPVQLANGSTSNLAAGTYTVTVRPGNCSGPWELYSDGWSSPSFDSTITLTLPANTTYAVITLGACGPPLPDGTGYLELQP